LHHVAIPRHSFAVPRSDEELLADWQAGDRRAGEELTKRHYDAVLRFFELKCTHVADDLTQQTFLACTDGNRRFRGDGSFRGYLFGIARIKLLEQIRANARDDKPRRFGQEDDPALVTGLTTLVARRQEHQLVLQAMAALSPEALLPLQLYYWESLSTREIAEALDVPQSTVTSRLARAREALREQLQSLTRPGRLQDSALAEIERWTRELTA
jgi:RNA polymerase sigma-70 factor (ECF subfamily)